MYSHIFERGESSDGYCHQPDYRPPGLIRTGGQGFDQMPKKLKLAHEVLKHNRQTNDPSVSFDPSFMHLWIQTMEHKLRTSTSLILGYADLLVCDPTDIQQSAAQVIHANASQISDMINKVSVYAAMLSGNYVWIDFDLSELAANMTSAARSHLESLGLHFQTSYMDEPMYICGDPVLIQTAIAGMLEVAAAGLPVGNEIMLTIEKQNEFVIVRVRSQGLCKQELELACGDRCSQTTSGADTPSPSQTFISSMVKIILETFNGWYSFEHDNSGVTVQQGLLPLPD